jgi:phosphopantothenoylcysteine decarboxylase/phosphopantothenate--cysteine ligase
VAILRRRKSVRIAGAKHLGGEPERETLVKSGRLSGRRVLLGVTGSIAAYKAVVLARLLVKEGAAVDVVMTASATQFVGASTFAGVTGRAALTSMFDTDVGGERHVDLAAKADLVLVVPATADLLARIAAGRAGDLLTATILCARCPVLVAPGMHPSMWSHPATERNVATLRKDGRVAFVGPVEGEVASGDTGMGRMAEPEEILGAAVACLSHGGDLAGRHLVVTAGPTVEDIDPVRFLGNRSSGKMGFALAERAALRGATVTLVAGPVALPTPPLVRRIDVRSALDMQRALSDAARGGACDAVLMAAAVGDYRPEHRSQKKMKRKAGATLTIPLVENPDLLAELGRARKGSSPALVGFALETGKDAEIVAYARGKLREKRVDLIVANHASDSMGREDNRVLLVDSTDVEVLPVMPKRDVADRILDRLQTMLGENGRGADHRPGTRAGRRRKRRA